MPADAAHGDPKRAFRPQWAAVHVALFLAEALLAAALGVWISGQAACRPEAEANNAPTGEAFERAVPARHGGNSSCHRGRRLVATDFTSEFSRRLLFHKWVEDDVVLDRKALGQYLGDARRAAGLSSQSRAVAASAPLTLQEITRQLGTAGLLVDACPLFSRKKPARLQLDLQQKRPKNTLKVCHSSVLAVH